MVVCSRMNAVEAAVRVAERFGLRSNEPVLLRSTKHVVAWLRPSAVVAKVGVHTGDSRLAASVQCPRGR